jgi:catechol 2,3-dioxygenase-like lactoylglutathione lyase family enzyme
MNDATLRGVTPVFPVGDVDATGEWYQDILGFAYDPFPESPPASFAILSRDGVEIFLQRVEGYRKPDLASQRPGGVWDVYIQVAGLESLWERVAALPSARGPEDRFYGQREIEIRDPNGYVLVFAERTNGGRS